MRVRLEYITCQVIVRIIAIPIVFIAFWVLILAAPFSKSARKALLELAKVERSTNDNDR